MTDAFLVYICSAHGEVTDVVHESKLNRTADDVEFVVRCAAPLCFHRVKPKIGEDGMQCIKTIEVPEPIPSNP